ncbi:MAG: FHA domain-containing protein [Acidobacteriota bacterium]
MVAKRNLVPFFISGCVLLFLAVCSLEAQHYRKVDSLAGAGLNDAVAVEGTVQRWVSGLGGNFYILRTNWGEEILVRTSRALPAIDKRYEVRGVVTEQMGKRFISEEELRLITEETTRETEASGAAVMVQVPKVEMGAPAPGPSTGTELGGIPQQTTSEVSAPQKAGGVTALPTRELLPWFLAGAGVLAMIVAVVMFARRRPSPSTEFSVGMASSPLAMAPVRTEPDVATAAPKAAIPEPQGVTGTTVKIHRPPAGTLKVLPGRFEVVSGETEVKEIRFYKVPSQAVPEVTFGRLAGAPYVHVQLNSPTVSGRQAKMTYQDGKWVLTNFAPATSNPTRVQGRELGVDESVALREGDQVEMGEVVLRFHER